MPAPKAGALPLGERPTHVMLGVVKNSVKGLGPAVHDASPIAARISRCRPISALAVAFQVSRPWRYRGIERISVRAFDR